MNTCPLCSSDSQWFHQDNVREYWRCLTCSLVFVPETFHLAPDEEKAQYDHHENNPDDQSYRGFLNRLYQPMIERLPESGHGLDFGSGPGPTLSVMFEEAGYEMALFDIFYAQDRAALDSRYDFITTTEVVEHLSKPAIVFNQLWDMLEPGGWLGIMTKMVVSSDAFSTWHYKNDPTHIAFYSEATFTWLADHFSAELELVGADVVLMSK